MIDAHRGAFEYDWRARFQLPTSVIGDSMTWGEALRHVNSLTRDPSSHVAAAVHEWEHPVSREALVLMATYDLQLARAWVEGGKKGSKPEPYPRPWKREAEVTRLGNTDGMTNEQVRQILNAHGHSLN